MQASGRAKRRCSIAATSVMALVGVCLSGAPPALATCTPTTYAVTTQADETTPSDGVLSLREAIQAANADGNPCGDIIALPGGRYPITAAQGGAIQITREQGVTIQPQLAAATARDVVIDGGGSDALFHVTSTAKFNTFERVTLTNGTGALMNDGAATEVRYVTVAGNRAPAGFGGGIYNSVGAQLGIFASTISNNTAGLPNGPAGGGIYNEGEIQIVQSTISGNTVSGNEAVGGGIYNNGSVSLFNSTVDRNTATGAGAEAGDIDTTSTAKTSTKDSLFGGGSPDNCNSTLTPILKIGDQSISSDITCTGTALDPKLGPLQDNGGGTDTEMLLTGSPAIDVISAPCPPFFDQRGVALPQASKCDVGAYELVQSADVGVSGSASASSVSQGSELTFTFNVASTAPSFDASLAHDAVQATLTDVLPAGLQFVSGSAGCSASGQTITCNPGALADNAGPAAVTIIARAAGVGAISNTATVSSPRPDSNPGDDGATVTVTSNALPSITPVLSPIAPPLGQPPLASLTLLGMPRITAGAVSCTLVCAGSPCLGTATATSVERLLGRRVLGVSAARHKPRVRKKPVTVGSTSFSIPAGQTRSVTIRLNAAGRRLLTRFRTLPATLTIRLQSAGSTLTAASARVTFKSKKKPRTRRH
jgi:CSLREA domain-containing protein/uncharacterized repeat protein (TIGR01451 family)